MFQHPSAPSTLAFPIESNAENPFSAPAAHLLHRRLLVILPFLFAFGTHDE